MRTVKMCIRDRIIVVHVLIRLYKLGGPHSSLMISVGAVSQLSTVGGNFSRNYTTSAAACDELTRLHKPQKNVAS